MPLSRASAVLLATISLSAVQVSLAHPGSGIVVDNEGQVYFVHTGLGIWRIDAEGALVRHDGPGFHFLAEDPSGRFLGQQWPRVREQMREGVIEFGDAEIRPVGRTPTLLAASSFPIAVGPEGALYYPDVGLEERVHIMRLLPSKEPTDFATLPLAMEIAPSGDPWKALWVHGLAAAPDGSLYYTEREAVRRIDANGEVTRVVDDVEVPGCVLPENHRGGAMLRGLDVAPDGTLYVASFACRAVLRITPNATVEVTLRAEEPWTPTGIAIREGNVYVLEYWFGDVERAQDWRPRVRRLSPDGSVSVLGTVAAVPEE